MKIFYRTAPLTNVTTYSRNDFTELTGDIDATAQIKQQINGRATTIEFSGSWVTPPITKGQHLIATQSYSTATSDIDVPIVKLPNYFTVTSTARRFIGGDYRTLIRASDRLYECYYISINKNFVNKPLIDIANECVACSGWLNNCVFTGTFSTSAKYSFDFTNTTIVSALRTIGDLLSAEFFVNENNQIEFVRAYQDRRSVGKRPPKGTTTLQGQDTSAGSAGTVKATPLFETTEQDIVWNFFPVISSVEIDEQSAQPINEVRVFSTQTANDGTVNEISGTASDITETDATVTNYNSAIIENSSLTTTPISPIQKLYPRDSDPFPMLSQFTFFWKFKITKAIELDLNTFDVLNVRIGNNSNTAQEIMGFQIFRVGDDGTANAVYFGDYLPTFAGFPESCYTWHRNTQNQLFFPSIGALGSGSSYAGFGDTRASLDTDALKLDLCEGSYIVAFHATDSFLRDFTSSGTRFEEGEWYPLNITSFRQQEPRSGRTQQQYEDWLDTNTPDWFESDWQIKRFNDTVTSLKGSYQSGDYDITKGDATASGNKITFNFLPSNRFASLTDEQKAQRVQQIGRMMELSRQNMEDNLSKIIDSKPSTSTEYFDGRIMVTFNCKVKSHGNVSRRNVSVGTSAINQSTANEAARQILNSINIPRQNATFEMKNGKIESDIFTKRYPSVFAINSDTNDKTVRVGDSFNIGGGDSSTAEGSYTVSSVTDTEQDGDFTTVVELENGRQDNEREIIARLFPD